MPRNIVYARFSIKVASLGLTRLILEYQICNGCHFFFLQENTYMVEGLRYPLREWMPLSRTHPSHHHIQLEQLAFLVCPRVLASRIPLARLRLAPCLLLCFALATLEGRLVFIKRLYNDYIRCRKIKTYVFSTEPPVVGY